MTRKRTKLAAGAGAALAVVGAGGAVAATRLSPAEESKAVVEDAAKQLGVDPAKLNEALTQALENRIDEAVQEGRLTSKQGEALKARIGAGAFPLFGLGHRGRPRFPRPRRGGRVPRRRRGRPARTDARRGDSRARLRRQQRKSVDGLVTRDRLRDHEATRRGGCCGRMTKAQRDLIVASLKQRTTEIVNGTFPALSGREGSVPADTASPARASSRRARPESALRSA